MTRRVLLFAIPFLAFLVGLFLHLGKEASASEGRTATKSKIEWGKYLVTVAGCNDCHTPKVFDVSGMIMDDTTRLLAGHPAEDVLPEFPLETIGIGKWAAVANPHFTAWAGPWGVSFARNLTPDKATGLGSWTEEIFIKALRTGKDMGEGRDILPPMPWFNFAQMTDDDLSAIFAYLQSVKPIENAVPDPMPPPASWE